MDATTKNTSQYLDNKSFNPTFEMYEHIGYETDGVNVRAKQSNLMAQKITTIGDVTYIAKAPIGTAQATAGWQAKKIETSGADTVITWAGGAAFNQVATDLTALTYS